MAGYNLTGRYTFGVSKFRQHLILYAEIKYYNLSMGNWEYNWKPIKIQEISPSVLAKILCLFSNEEINLFSFDNLTSAKELNHGQDLSECE